MKHKILLTGLMLLLGLTISAQDSGTCGENLTWTLENGTLTISGTGEMTNYDWNYAPWYSYRESITSISIADGVTSIGSYAFLDCRSLTSVTIPNNVTSIGGGAFHNCRSLTSVTIPNSVTSIGKGAFSKCSSLTSVYISDIAAWCRIQFAGDYANPLSYAKHLYVNNTEITDLVIPNSVTSIGNYAFSGCSSLTSVTIPNSVTSIEDYAFWCSSLTSVPIPESVTSIGRSAFEGCSSLTSVTIPNSVTSIGQYAFYGCSSLTSVTCEAQTPTSLGDDVFPNNIPVYVPCGTIEEYRQSEWGVYKLQYLPCKYNVSVIFDKQQGKVEHNLSKLSVCDASLEMTATPNDGYNFTQWSDGNTDNPRIVELTQDTAFTAEFAIDRSGACGENLTWTLENGTLTISGTGEMTNYDWNGTPWYSYRESITSVFIADGVTSIGSFAFYNCSSMTSVTIPNSVTSIGERAFYWCISLTSVIIPNSVTRIGDAAFSNCNNLTSITIPDGVTDLRRDTFRKCNKLTSVTIGNSVTSIGGWAFTDCSSLTSVTIGNSVTSIGNNAFESCSSLTSVTIPQSVTSIGEYAFSKCSSLTSVTIGNGVTSIGEHAFFRCSSLPSVIIPNSVISIGDGPFSSCNSLILIKVDAANTAYCDIDGVLFSKDKKTLIQYPIGKTAASYTIPNSVASIGDCAFMDCSSLTSVTIPNSVTSIGGYAFLGCSSLTSITIPNSVTSIGWYAFFGCSSLASVTIGNSVTSIGTEAFHCYSLTSITCEAVNPPDCDSPVFNRVDIDIYVPANSIDAYKESKEWCKFMDHIKPISAEGAELPEDKVQTDASENGVVIEWPASTGADTYIITIKYNTAVVCVLTFDADGRLLDISIPHVAARDRRNAEAALQTVKGWQYTIKGLNAGTTYDYIVTAKNSSTELYSKGGTFKTKGTATGIEETDGESGKNGYSGRDGSAVKVMRDGVTFIVMPDGRMYDLQGKEVEYRK